jgi:hypothetical protein
MRNAHPPTILETERHGFGGGADNLSAFSGFDSLGFRSDEHFSSHIAFRISRTSSTKNMIATTTSIHQNVLSVSLLSLTCSPS